MSVRSAGPCVAVVFCRENMSEAIDPFAMRQYRDRCRDLAPDRRGYRLVPELAEFPGDDRETPLWVLAVSKRSYSPFRNPLFGRFHFREGL